MTVSKAIKLKAFLDTPEKIEPVVSEVSVPLICQLWAARILVRLNLAARVASQFSYSDAEILSELGIETPEEPVAADLNKTFVAKLNSIDPALAHIPEGLKSNIRQLGKLVNLSDTEQAALCFIVLLKSYRSLEAVVGLVGDLARSEPDRVFSAALELPISQCRKILREDSTLFTCGVLRLDRNFDRMADRFDFISTSFADAIRDQSVDPINLLRDIVQRAPKAELVPDDYSQLQHDLPLLQKYMSMTLENKKTGVNILLYGLPGTGKTQLTRVIADLIGAPLYEVSTVDMSGDPLQGHLRLQAFRLAQNLLGTVPSLLVFDEVDDIFGLQFHGRAVMNPKGWLNHTLETNPVPCFWITNNIELLEESYIRRFDMVLKLDMAERSQRVKAIERVSRGMLSADHIEQLAGYRGLTPAIVQRAVQVISSLDSETLSENTFDIIDRWTKNYLTAQGYSMDTPKHKVQIDGLYDLDYLNTDVNLALVTEELISTPSAKICLHGPSGAGKTSYAAFIAKKLNRPLLQKRGSDLISKWVGETERNIANAFHEAQQSDSVLLLDEIDSMLSARSDHEQHWHRSMVNEILSQLDDFKGLLIATTNQQSWLDHAALRRFDLSIHFDFLSSAQTKKLLSIYEQKLELVPVAGAYTMLEAIPQLTVAHFSQAAAKARFTPMKTSVDFVKFLKPTMDLTHLTSEAKAASYS